MSKYTRTEDYIYSLFERNSISEFHHLTTLHKQNILEILLLEADKEVNGAINSWESDISNQLALNIIHLDKNFTDLRKDMIEVFFGNAKYLIKSIFESAKTAFESEDKAESEYQEYKRFDDRERARYVNDMLVELF